MKRDNLVILNVINFISESYERSWTNFFFLIFRFLKHYFSMLFLGSNDFGQVYCYIWYDANFYFKPTCSLPLKNVFYTSKLSSVLLPERNYAFPICTFLFPTSLSGTISTEWEAIMYSSPRARLFQFETQFYCVPI